MIIMSAFGFIFGFSFAFYWGWIFTLILLGAFPFLVIVGMAMGVALNGGITEQMKAYAQSAGYAEQALSAIKVVHTYGNELLELNNYNRYLSRAHEASKTVTFRVAAGNSVLFGVIFGFYAYSFFWGGFLRYNDILNGELPYTGGAILSCMFCVVFSSF